MLAEASKQVDRLLDEKEDPNSTNKEDVNKLCEAASLGVLETVERLLDQGMDSNSTDKEGHTPLHQAAHKGQLDVVQLLLKKGAKPNKKTTRAKRHRI